MSKDTAIWLFVFLGTAVCRFIARILSGDEDDE